jgi:RNA polymerase sigma-70 factor (family 1)
LLLSNAGLHNEKILLEAISRGDQEAFRELFNAYWDRMYANSLRFVKSPELATDLTQEVFIKIWLCKDQLGQVQQFENYLYRVSKNLFHDHLRKHFATDAYIDMNELAVEENAPNPQTRMEFSEMEKLVNKAIEFLPTQMQTAFKLSRFHGLSHKQIADRMNISKITSQNYIARSLMVIRKYLHDHSSLCILLAALSVKKFF